MQNCDYISISLPTETPSSGATWGNNGIAVVDGITPFIYLFNECGGYKCTVNAKRPYKKISYDCERELYIALGCGCYGAIYVLNCRFVETGVITLEKSFGSITDVGIYKADPYLGYIAVTFINSIHLYNFIGEYIGEIKPENENIFYLNYQSLPNGYAISYEKDGVSYIGVSINGTSYTSALPDNLTLKSIIIKCCGDISGFFGHCYSYNYIVPITLGNEYYGCALNLGTIIEKSSTEKCEC